MKKNNQIYSKLIKFTFCILGICAIAFLSLYITTIGYDIEDDNKKHENTSPGIFDTIVMVSTEKQNMNELLSYISELQSQKDDLINEIDELETKKQEIIYDNVIDCYVPEGAGSSKSYMGYYQDWIYGTKQQKFHDSVEGKVLFDKYGFATLNGRYFVATKPYYGDIGDMLDVYLENGEMIPCIIGDNKGMENDDIYVHYDGTIVEFMVDTSIFKSVISVKPEFISPITSIKNLGQYN